MRTWLTDNWRGTDDSDWRRRLAESGWAAPPWPADSFGRGLSPAPAQMVRDEFHTARARSAAVARRGFSALAGNTIVEFGSPELKREILPNLLSGEWSHGCLLYNEPSNGSDLAGLQTYAAARRRFRRERSASSSFP
ncbi:alkylation response protein AidB-like acyl-CoA dehydrogenase [Nocardia kruczakiae]|uniref:Alkylation response protein AidB-like acyl-CoA dehydrogenase n=1 Tax=Nocardia kruczakiae TaxID=261477 RepID=A0ABU1X9S3_9NOCA|nr:acyl-CoA dehydrogenase family protein [Nocardia kruczakiae]MDR7167288.1 alkylation response protein AidB-like acyl-CoA dehydrogenase [Nocardia kruczakiae]